MLLVYFKIVSMFTLVFILIAFSTSDENALELATLQRYLTAILVVTERYSQFPLLFFPEIR